MSASFHCLPAELRNMIYDHVLSWDGVSIISERSRLVKKALDGYWEPREGTSNEMPSGAYLIHRNQQGHCYTKVCDVSTFEPKRSTPALLLANRQIHQEALSMLLSKPLVFEEPLPVAKADWIHQGQISVL